MKTYEIGIIGGGIVGLAIAFGELLRGKSVIIIDGNKSDNKASFANFGLIWSQGKGMNFPAYQSITKRSSDSWSIFAKQLEDISGTNLQYEHNGGLVYCLGDEDFEARKNHLIKLEKELGWKRDWEMIGRNETQNRVGNMKLGPNVVGASYSFRDGAINPLLLWKALNIAIDKLGGKILKQSPVQSLNQTGVDWEIKTSKKTIFVGSVFVAAGLGTKKIVEKLGIDLPISGQKGQILVSERLPHSLKLPGSGMRQTLDGSFLIGATHEECTNRRSTVAAGVMLSKRALSFFPELQHVKMVRQWAGYRIMTPDGYPIYAQPRENMTIAVCHSGITLAAFHSSDWTTDPEIFQNFSKSRFGKSE